MVEGFENAFKKSNFESNFIQSLKIINYVISIIWNDYTLMNP